MRHLFVPIVIWATGFIIGLVEGKHYGFWAAHVGNIFLHFLYKFDHEFIPYFIGQLLAGCVLIFPGIELYVSISLCCLYIGNIIRYYYFHNKV